jgi:hypothetical protein
MAHVMRAYTGCMTMTFLTKPTAICWGVGSCAPHPLVGLNHIVHVALILYLELDVSRVKVILHLLLGVFVSVFLRVGRLLAAWIMTMYHMLWGSASCRTQVLGTLMQCVLSMVCVMYAFTAVVASEGGPVGQLMQVLSRNRAELPCTASLHMHRLSAYLLVTMNRSCSLQVYAKAGFRSDSGFKPLVNSALQCPWQL